MLKKSLYIVIAVIMLLMYVESSVSQQFQKVDHEFTGLSHGNADWVDINDDTLLDIFITGLDDSGNSKTLVYLNQGNGNFEEFNSRLPYVSASDIAWEDFDKDGDIDLLLSGLSDQGELVSGIYRNDNQSGFTRLDFDFIKVHSGSVMWIDYDNDSRQDIFITGLNSDGETESKLYKNTGDAFEEVISQFHSLYNSSYEFYDLDNDGDFDVLFSGQSGISKNSYITRIFINNNGSFIESNNTFPSISKGSASWGDLDADGFGDFIINGETDDGYKMMVMHNDHNGTFTKLSSEMPGIIFGKVLWADFDNDGLLDILITGNLEKNNSGITKLYRNDNGSFSEVENDLPDVLNGTVSAGDYNNDLKLDILITAYDPVQKKNITSVYKNLIDVQNDLPVEPKGLTTTFDNQVINFNWLPGTDDNTPSPGLTYNLRVGITPGGSEIISPVSLGINGFSKFPYHGNMGNSLQSHSINLDSGTYYWSVQTVDNSYNTSNFSAEESFTVQKPLITGIPVPDYVLEQNYPNPFNPKTKISYQISKFNNVSLKVYNVLGVEVAELVNENQRTGSYQIEFDGSGLSSGVYFYKLITDGFTDTKRMVILK